MNRKTFLYIAASGCALMSGTAWAQSGTASANEDATTQDIVVTAQFRAQNLQDTPLAITAATGAQLEARSQTNIVDIASTAPNVTLKTGGGNQGQALQGFIRGIGQSEFHFGLEPGVGLYIDDVYRSTTSGAALDLLDLDRVEVLRGPQGTLSGKNSIGGSIKLFSKKPTGSGDGYAQLLYGSFNRIEGRAGADFALVPDKLFARVSVAGKSTDGYVDRIDYGCAHPGEGIPNRAGNGKSCKVGEEGGYNYAAGRAALRFVPNDTIEINLVGDYMSQKGQPFANRLYKANTAVTLNGTYFNQTNVNGVGLDNRFASSDPYVTYSSYCNYVSSPNAPSYCFPAESNIRDWGVAGTIDINLTDTLKFTSISAYRGNHTTYVLDIDGSPLAASQSFNILDSKQFTQEVRLSGSFGSLIDYTVGGFLLSADNYIGGRVDINYNAPGFGWLLNDPSKAKTQAGFAQLIVHLTDRLNVTGGLRYTHESKRYTYGHLLQDGSGPDFTGVNGVSTIYKGSRWDYRLNADYKLTDDIMVYAQVATGFKGGGSNPRPFSAANIYQFKPETIVSYEAGAKTMWFDHRLRLNAALFYSDYKDIQQPPATCVGGPCIGPSNVGDAHIQGFELEANFEPVDGLVFDGSLSHLDFDYTKISSPGIGLDATTPFASDWQWSAGLQYTANLPGGSSLVPRVDANYRSAIYTNAQNSPDARIPGYTLVNARLTWKAESDKIELSAAVTNLFDKFYYASLTDNSAANLGAMVFGTPGRPREWSMSVKYKF